MPNPFQISGAQPARPSRKAPLYQGARFSSGLWTNRSPIRDAASTRLEEKFYGPRGDAFLGGENLEISQKLTLIRRPGNPVWNTNSWSNVNSFYEFRIFNSNTEQIKTMVDTQQGLYDASNNGQVTIWNKSPYSGQSYLQSVGNILYWGDGASTKKWINTLQTRIPYSTVLQSISEFPNNTAELNPYNFTPFELNSFIIDTNGNAEQLIGTVVQLSSFYILNSVIVFTMKSTDSSSNPLPTASQVLSSGLQLYFAAGTPVSEALNQGAITLTIQNIVGPIATASIFFGGQGYAVNENVNVNQITPAGGMGGEVRVLTVGTSAGTGYATQNNVPTTTSGLGQNCNLDVVAFSGGLASATIAAGGTGYAVGDFLFPQEVNEGTGGYFLVVDETGGAVTTVSLCTGVALTVEALVGGNGYETAENVPTSAGSGTGLAVNIVSSGTQFSCAAPGSYSGGPITSATPDVPGTGYHPNDELFPMVPVQDSGTGATLLVNTISGIPATVGLVYGGPSFTGYTVASGLPTFTSGSGTGATFNILTVSAGQIATYSLGSGGTGYSVGDSLAPNQATGAGASYTVSTVSTGVITGITQDNPGFLPYTVATGVATNTSGSGSGATISITGVTNGAITSGTLDTAGTGYVIGDRLYPIQSGTSGLGAFRVATLTGGSGGVATINVSAGGTGFISATDLSTTTNQSGTGCTVNIVAGSSFFPPTSISEDVDVFSGGNPISSYTANNDFTWPKTVGTTTVDGSALWINRGSAIDGGLVYNWGMAGGNTAPTVVVNNAVGEWTPNTYYNRWQIIVVTVSGSKYIQQLFEQGVSGSSAPSWDITPGQITTDGTAKWVCLSNDGDTTLSWITETIYSPGHILEETVSSVGCVFQLQPFTGITTAGTNFPVYCWQCNSQAGSDVGAAGELPNGSSGNTPMAQNGNQPTSTASYAGTANSLFLSAQGGANPLKTAVIGGDGTVPSSLTQLFPATENLSVAMLPVLNIPAAGIYTFTIGHQVASFWGIGSGSITLDISSVQVNNNTLTIKCTQNVSQLISDGIQLTFAGATNASFLNGKTVTVSSVSGFTFNAAFTHSNYGPAQDTGTATSGNTLTPSVISGPMTWNNSGSPNTYNFSTGTPINGYPIMSANYPAQGNNIVVDTVQVSFPSAGAYPAEILYGSWYHSTGSYVAPTTSPVLPGTTFSFYMVYSPPGSTTNYNIVPQAIACTSASAPTWPAWPATLAGLQAISPAYPMVTEASGNYTWWNIGPSSTFDWNASATESTSTFIVDPNSNEEIAYEPGVSGTAEPTFSTTLYGLTADINTLVWMNNGPVSNLSAGTLTTTEGGWQYAIALVNTLDDTVSNASLISVSTGNFFEATGVFISGGLPQYIDPQADYVAIFRTQDGGATFFLIPPPASGNGNTEYTVPLAQYLAQGFTDTALDSQLNTLLEAPLAQQNSLPPQGAINPEYQDGRIFVSVANTVKWSTGPDTPIGNGYNGFDPDNFAEFPSLVKRLVSVNIGMLVFTVSDIFLISGNGTSGAPFTSQQYIQRVGLLDYNALTINGSIMYFMTADNQVVELSMHAGLSEVGFPIADLLSEFDPTKSYLSWHVHGQNDQCLFVADGSTGWYRMCPTPAPEVGSLTWNLKANIVGGCGAIQSIETSPGNIQLLLAPTPGFAGPILYRDYNSWTDNGYSYGANFILGSIVMAYPGQVATPIFITTECLKGNGTQPISLGVRIGEVAGEFEDLVFWSNDPPQLPPSETLFNQRFYLSQTKKNILCRHMQIIGQFNDTNSPDELYTITVYGGFLSEG